MKGSHEMVSKCGFVQSRKICRILQRGKNPRGKKVMVHVTYIVYCTMNNK